ncbi:tyrosinase [Nitrosomonas marina]|uniref:Tyrosinase n=1 Tax=Nitrosomonas marina TaxID=917 RepID=A0A1I0B865_9PROT|nr:tyrosinase family protein [Nitrosomonas marina]SET02241.1 tyrosinase [Nitrosomonas marina]
MRNRKKLSRYQRVQQILDQSQGPCIPDYQGLGAFWRDLNTFKTAELYGQRLIAPEPDESDHQPDSLSGKSCCGEGDGMVDSLAASESALNQALVPGGSDATVGECWPTGGKNPAQQTASSLASSTDRNADQGYQTRSDRSALIKGLRKQFPFDGSQFPPLLWQAENAVSPSDIDFIAAWIDDGCLESDDLQDNPEESTGPQMRFGLTQSGASILALAKGDALHTVSTKHCNAISDDVQGLKIRKEVSTLSANELSLLREALACMYTYDPHIFDERSFNYWARIHTDSCQHGWEQFLPWHRLYLYFFEQTLQDYDACITLPYWSWSDYADVNRATYNTEQLDMGVLPEAYGCFLDAAGLAALKDSGLFNDGELAILARLQKKGTIYNSGLRFLKAAKIDYTLKLSVGKVMWSDKVNAIYAQLRRANPLWFPNRWPGSLGIATHYPTAADVQGILSSNNWNQFGGGPVYDHHFGWLEEMHNGMHNFSGGQNPAFLSAARAIGVDNPDPQNSFNPNYGYMTDNRVTAFDPIFWAHHSNVDRLWAVWQEAHPGLNPEDLDGILPPWSMNVGDTLSTRKLGYEYMRDSYHYPVSGQQGLLRFNAEKAGVKPQVLDTFRKAEIRLHRMHVANLFNAVIRVFLNAPDATVATSVDNNPHFVGQVTTFHGSCYGGPGHCDKPLPKTRRFDQRPLHHHEPRNFRIDATEAVQRMLANGETDISVHLVVMGLDGKPIDDAVFINGVSLNFMD